MSSSYFCPPPPLGHYVVLSGSFLIDHFDISFRTNNLCFIISLSVNSSA